jgi:2'-5' RNA ligase
MIRAFIAVNISDDQKREASAMVRRLSSLGARVKWVESSNLHITLKFLGDTDEKLLPELYESVEIALKDAAGFDLSFEGLGCFPNPRRPKVIWIGIKDGYENLKSMAGQIEKAVVPLGFEPEGRPFSAHLTIGRVKDDRGIELLTKELPALQFLSSVSSISKAVFYQSTLRPDGPIYTPLKTFELKR